MVALQIPASSPRPQSSCHVDAMAKSNIQVSRFIWPLYCSVKTQEYSKVKEKKSDEHVASSCAGPTLTAGGPDCQAAYMRGKSD